MSEFAGTEEQDDFLHDIGQSFLFVSFLRFSVIVIGIFNFKGFSQIMKEKIVVLFLNMRKMKKIIKNLLKKRIMNQIA